MSTTSAVPAAPGVRSVPQTAPHIVRMDSDDLRQLDGDSRCRMIICREGRIWVTQERDWRDYVLEARDIFVVTHRGQVLVEALQEACVEITPPLNRPARTGQLSVFR